jgi:hypothetical protein
LGRDAGAATAGDGKPKVDANGKPLFTPTVEFRDRATAGQFREMIIALVRAAHPGALDRDSGE